MPSAVVSFEDVCFSYGPEEVLHNVCFSIGDRDLVAFVGPNGGGKTTLLRLTLGLLKPQRGRVRVFGEAPADVRRRVGYVPQHLWFDPQFPVNALDVVKMGRVDRHLVGPYRRVDRDAAHAALGQVGLEDLASRSFASLSGGERQRVLIAQALVTDPALLLMDEPTANVDYLVERQLYGLLQRLSARLTVVVVSHNLNVVTGYATQVVCVNRTAALHRASEVTSSLLGGAEAGDMVLLQHHQHCHVIDPSEALRTPHLAEPEPGSAK